MELIARAALLSFLLTLIPADSGSQSVTPRTAVSVAQRVAPGDTPLNLIETPDGYLISTNSGYGAHYLQAYDEQRNNVAGRFEFPSLWYGLAYVPGQRSLLASTGAHSVLMVPFHEGKFGTPREMAFNDCELTAGIALQDQTTAVVVCNRSYEAIRFNFRTGEILKRVRVGEFPYSVKALSGNRLAVANWGQASVSILDGQSLKVLRTISVGSHPTDELVLPGQRQLLVACSDSDLVSVIDLESLREVRRLKIAIPNSEVGGGQPNAFALNPATGKIFVALAAVNALAVLDLAVGDEPKLDGLIPVGAYPTALLYSTQARTLYIADGRNLVSGPSSPREAASGSNGGIVEPRRGPAPSSPPAHTHKTDSGQRTDYIGYLLGGGIEALADADVAEVVARGQTLAQQVYGQAPRAPDAKSRELIRHFSARGNPHAPIRHVIYIIKENRTYDQLLGDMPEGNGAPDLVLFGQSVTPNHHALARQFVLFDNFYVDGDVSADGHVWSTAASSTDYVNKLWPSFYAHRLKYDFLGPDYDGDEQHDQPFVIPKSGAIWDLAQKSGISYRDYGEWCVDENAHPGLTRCYLRGLKDHYDPHYVDGIGAVTDVKRIGEWEREFREFEKSGNLPQLTVMHLPNDHTRGTQPGRFTPRAMVADNDLALGRLVEIVSHSRFWPETAIFVLEDDAQDGPDHVDAHRSPLLIASPYVRHGAIEHAHFSTTSVLKTIEQILGLPSLTYFDDRAPGLLVDFQQQPMLEGYTARPPQVSLDEVNPPNAPGAKQSARWDFSRPDRAPERDLNRVIWKSVKGANSEPPPPILTAR
ncbi:MAG TPA: bifunctional YncE family protein/alkaline phosphatase family protein [Terriglobia bacterium]|nr:bifunctional YncE family protein/alkaline phosphatase family protein [Terriglobia bacterium]